MKLIPDVDQPLQAVGDLLARAGLHFSLVIAGGAALNLLGLVRRPTEDIDVLAVRTRALNSEVQVVPPARPLPEALADAIQQVADDFQLPGDWMNTNVAGHWRTGLPPGWIERIHWRESPGLSLGLVDRYDLIFFKLYAAADHAQIDPRFYRPSKHDHDLIALAPTDDEFAAARTWVCAQDGSPQYTQCVDNVMTYVRGARA